MPSWPCSSNDNLGNIGCQDPILPCVEELLSRRGHVSFLELPALKILQRTVLHTNGIDQNIPGRIQAVPESKALHWQWMRIYWPEIKNKGDFGALILPYENTDSLIQLYLLYDKYLFNGELPPPTTNPAKDGRPGVQLVWMDQIPHPTGKTALGQTISNDDWQPIKILLLRRPSKQRYLTGANAMAVKEALLHEMCHVYERDNICWRLSCEPRGRPHSMRGGRTGHGNAFFFPAWLVEMAANKTFGAEERVDLRHRVAYYMKQQARKEVWRDALEQGLPLEPMVTPRGRVIVPRRLSEGDDPGTSLPPASSN